MKRGGEGRKGEGEAPILTEGWTVGLDSIGLDRLMPLTLSFAPVARG